MGHKVLCLAPVCIYPAEGEASGARWLFPPSIYTNVGCMWPVEQGNETGLTDWPEDQSLDSP